MAGRLWARHGSNTLPADTLDRLVAAYGPGRDVTALLRALFLDPAFRSDRSSLVAARSSTSWASPRPRPHRPARGPARPGAAGHAGGARAGAVRTAERGRLARRRGLAVHRGDAGAADLRRGRGRRTADLSPVRQAADRPGAAAPLLGVDGWTPAHAGRADGRRRRPGPAGHAGPGQPRIRRALRRHRMDTLTRRRFLVASGVTGAAALAAGAGTLGWREIAARTGTDPLAAGRERARPGHALRRQRRSRHRRPVRGPGLPRRPPRPRVRGRTRSWRWTTGSG